MARMRTRGRGRGSKSQSKTRGRKRTTSMRSKSRRRSASGTSARGFASMDPEKQRRIAAMGGRASHGGRGRDYGKSPSRRKTRSYDDDERSSWY